MIKIGFTADSQIPGSDAYLRPTRSTFLPCLATIGKAVAVVMQASFSCTVYVALVSHLA